MNDIDLLDFMVRQYQTQAKMATALKLTDGAISKWRSRGELPKGWRMYFQAQFDKTDEACNAAIKKAEGMMNVGMKNIGIMCSKASQFVEVGLHIHGNRLPSSYEKTVYQI